MTEKIYNPTSLGNTVQASRTSRNSLESKADKLILIVFDNVMKGQGINELISKKYRTITANTGNNGLNLSQTEHPDLIIADTDFSDMKIYEFCDELLLQKHCPSVYIIGTNHKDEIIPRMKKSHTPILGYCPRMYNPKELIDVIDKYLSNKQ